MITGSEFSKDIQIHIHEHVGPLRERVGRIEGKIEYTDRELAMLRQGLETLQKSMSELVESGSTLSRKIDSMRNWIIGVGVGAATVVAAIEFFINIIKGGVGA